MEELALELLDTQFYYSAVDDCVFSIDNDRTGVGAWRIANMLRKAFNLSAEDTVRILAPWLLGQGAKKIEKKWNTEYIGEKTSIVYDTAHATVNNLSYNYELTYE